MNPFDYVAIPSASIASECPTCGGSPRWRHCFPRHLIHSLRYLQCQRCRSHTAKFSTWVGALAAWDRREVSPKVKP